MIAICRRLNKLSILAAALFWLGITSHLFFKNLLLFIYPSLVGGLIALWHSDYSNIAAEERTRKILIYTIRILVTAVFLVVGIGVAISEV